MYDSTLQEVNIDEVRVRYRQKRRELVREITLNNLTEPLIGKRARVFAKKEVGAQDAQVFLKNVYDDLHGVHEGMIRGLGMTPEELRAWKSHHPLGEE